MLVTVILLLITCGIVQGSGIHPVAPAGSAPIVTAASSQYFERTFNRLVAAPPVLNPVLPIAPAPVVPVFPVPPPRPFLSILPIASAPPVAVEATRTPTVPVNPPPSAPADSNIAIAIATAHAAAPVATILLPPYPFGFPPTFGVLPQAAQSPQAPPDPSTRESTTLKTTTSVQTTTKQQEEDPTTPVPTNIDNSFAQAPSNQNVNFRQYLAPQFPAQRPKSQQIPGPGLQQFPEPIPRPQQFPVQSQKPEQFPVRNQRPQQFPVPNQRPQLPVPSSWPQHVPQHLPLPEARPIKFRTDVEVVPVPLAYIAPPSPHHDHHHHQHHHHHQSIKVGSHIHRILPRTSKIIIIRPASANRLRAVRVPAGPGFAMYGPPKLVRRVASKQFLAIRSSPRVAERTTLRPINGLFTIPPRL